MSTDPQPVHDEHRDLTDDVADIAEQFDFKPYLDSVMARARSNRRTSSRRARTGIRLRIPRAARQTRR